MNNRHRRVNRLKARQRSRIIIQNNERWSAVYHAATKLAMAIGDSFDEINIARKWQEDNNWKK